jgi:hypothetical protein
MKCPSCGRITEPKKFDENIYICGNCEHAIRTTDKTADEILSYVANNFISPLCFDSRSGEDIYLEYSSEVFNKFVAFLLDKSPQV